MSATLGVGGALGLSLAVFITEAFTWHMIFWVPVGLHTVGTILVLVFLPESLVRTPARFLLLTSVIVFTGWGALQLRTREPLVDLRVSARPYVLFTNLASIHDRVLHVRDVTHVSAIAHGTGAYGVRSRSLDDTNRSRHGTRGVVMMLLSPVSARFSARRGPKTTLFVGAAVIVVGDELDTQLEWFPASLRCSHAGVSTQQ